MSGVRPVHACWSCKDAETIATAFACGCLVGNFTRLRVSGCLWDFVIQTPRGAVTRVRQGRQRGCTSTIDHFWTSGCLRTVYYSEDYLEGRSTTHSCSREERG